MKIYYLVALFALAIGDHARAEDSCDRAGLFEKSRAAPELKAAPVIPYQQGTQVSWFFLGGSVLAMDSFKYEAVVDSTARQAWVLRYGGIAGHVQWFGPVVIDPLRFTDCSRKFPAQYMHMQYRAPSQSNLGGSQ